MSDCARCAELEQALAEALASNESEEIEIGSAEEITQLKTAVRKAQKAARDEQKKAAKIIEDAKAYILELGNWRRKLPELESHCDDEGKKIIDEMCDWYAVFILG